MSSDPPELGKGIFGYRKSAVNQIIADRDLMLRQAEGRVRAAESKVANLEGELNAMKTRNSRMDEQLERLRTQLDQLSRQTPLLAPPQAEPWTAGPEAGAEAVPVESGQPEAAPAYAGGGEAPPFEEGEVSYGFELAEAQAKGEPGGQEAEEAVMETGPADYWSPEHRIEPQPEAEAEAFPAIDYEPQGVTSSTEEPVSAEERPDEVEELSYGAELASPYEPPADEVEEYREAPAAIDQPQDYDYEAPAYEAPAYEAPAYEAQTYEEPAYEAPTYEPPAYEPPAYEPAEAEGPSFEPHAYEPGEGPGRYETETYEPAPEAPPTAEAVRREPVRPAVSSESSDISSRFVTEEIAGVLSAAEESASRILERARVQSEQQIVKSARLWEEVRIEVSRLASWREGVEPIIQTVLTKVEGIRGQIEDVPERIREALAPMADSISGIDSDLAELAEACSPPLLLAPGGLEPEEGEGAGWETSDEDAESPGHEDLGEGESSPGHRSAG
jgi:predicted  nucleic acid-binding Zn-ribbon protein